MTEQHRARLYLFVSERAKVPGSKKRAEPQAVGTIYPEPYTSVLSTCSFSARILDALVVHAWQPTQTGNHLHVVLTPALANGEARVVRDSADFREVYVGLSRARWLSGTIADKRRILVSVSVEQLEPMRERWSLDWPALRRAAKDVIDSYETITAVVGDPTPVPLGAELADKLDASAWARTLPAARLAIARAVADRTRASGRDLTDPELVALPKGVAVSASSNGIPLALVPGGRMRRGFDSSQLARLDRIREEVWSFESDRPPDERFPRSLVPFGADAACALDSPDEVDVPPMWMAEATCGVDEERPPWDKGAEDGPRPATWRGTLAFVAQHLMTLPTSDELLWAASAGDARLFPWGDDASPIRDVLEGAAHVLAEAYGVDDAPYTPQSDADPFAVFAAKNPFGLAAPLSHATWCAPHPDRGDPTPLVRVGGALGLHPWQGGWEAMLFLTRVVSRVAFDGPYHAPRAAVLPIVRLSR